MKEFAGLLTQRIEIWKRADDRSVGGAQEQEWAPLARCLANVESEGTGLPAEAMSLSAMPRFRVTIRAGSTIDLECQVRWKGRRLAIRQLISDPAAPDRIVCRCEEIR